MLNHMSKQKIEMMLLSESPSEQFRFCFLGFGITGVMWGAGDITVANLTVDESIGFSCKFDEFMGSSYKFDESIGFSYKFDESTGSL